jgi:hypothetical protein
MSYRTWKYKTAPAPPETLNLQNPNDFPSLGSVKPTTIPQGLSLAEKLKMTIQAEEELSSITRFQKSRLSLSSKPSELQVLTMPNFVASLQEEEENYRWQISRNMYRSEQEAEPFEFNSSQTQEDDHYSNQEKIEEHDRT